MLIDNNNNNDNNNNTVLHLIKQNIISFNYSLPKVLSCKR